MLILPIKKDLTVPHNIYLLYLPPLSPELNTTEQIWLIHLSTYFANKTRQRSL
jgi:transposase